MNIENIAKIPKSVVNAFSLLGTIVFVLNVEMAPFSINKIGLMGLTISILSNFIRYYSIYIKKSDNKMPINYFITLFLIIVFIFLIFLYVALQFK